MENTIQTHVDLRPYNTLSLPATAAHFLEIRDIADLLLAAPFEERFVLGGGSNVVLTGDFSGLLLHMAIRGKCSVSETADDFLMEAGAGENWHDFVEWTLHSGFFGLENLIGIPGQVGAAPVQNIGAYGAEVAEFIESVDVWDFAFQGMRRLSAKDCRFGYRHSVFKEKGAHLNGQLVVCRVRFRLPKKWQPRLSYPALAEKLAIQKHPPTPLEIKQAIMEIRREKLPDPKILPNAGSFFENPRVEAEIARALKARYPDLPTYSAAEGKVKLAAAWLIESAGWKGKMLGSVGMYEKQALVLVNHGNATAADVTALRQAVTQSVLEKFGVLLYPEPVFFP